MTDIKTTTPLKIVYVPIDDLIAAEYNPRLDDPNMTEKLKKSFKEHGLVNPVIVNSAPNRKNILINGHFRHKTAKEMGFTTMPVVYLNIPDIEKEKALNLRLNRIETPWDWDKLQAFDISTLLSVGFDEVDLSNIWDQHLETNEDNFDTKAELEKIKTPTSKLGDIFKLGLHTVICGNSTDPLVVQKLVGKNLIDIVYCDSPYNIGLSYNNGMSTKGKYGGKTNDKKTDKEFSSFLQATLKNALNVAKPDCHIFYYCDEDYIGLIQQIYKASGVSPKRVCMWIKDNQNPTPKIGFNKAFEPCIYGIRGQPYLSPSITNLNGILNKEVSTGTRTFTDIMDLFNIWMAKRINGMKYEHPTEKSPTLHEKPLRRCTKPGDNVLDLFGGSGSTLIACEQLKRTCFLSEIEPIFIDLILKRYEDLTGIKPKKLN